MSKSIVLRIIVFLFTVYLAVTLVSLEVQFVKLKSEANLKQSVLDEKTARVKELSRLVEEGNETELIEKAARDRLGYLYPDEQVFIDPTGN